MKVAVIDGQGGGIGKALVEGLREVGKREIELYAFGTNALATSLMLKSGAEFGATGENAIRTNMNKMDVILGPMGIISANALLGEVTPVMAEAISESDAVKILIPVNKCTIKIAGLESRPFSSYIESAVEEVISLLSS